MKKKNYLSFALPRLVCLLVVGAVVFGVIDGYLKSTFSAARDSGFKKLGTRYRDMVRQYDEGNIDANFMRVILSFYASDYYRFAKVNEDGDFETIAEPEYDVIAVEKNMHDWYLVTKDEDLLAKGTMTSTTTPKDGIPSEWKFTYIRCDELFDIDHKVDLSAQNTWNMAELADNYYSTSPFFQYGVLCCGMTAYRDLAFETYYVDGNTLYPGRLVDTNGWVEGTYGIKKIYEKWNFTDPSKADRYHTVDRDIDGFAVFDRYTYPERFINANKEIFLVNNISDIEKIKAEEGVWNSGTWSVGRFDHEDGRLTEGEISVFEINGNKYMVEYVVTSMPYADYFRPFLICIGILIFVLCIAIALIISIHPYVQYKKAYENNNFKNNLIDSLAHNMKTPLQILGGYAENLKDVKSDAEKDRYADQILAKTTEMNKDIEAILKTAEKSDRKLTKSSVRACVEEAAKRVGAELILNGDREIKMDKDYFSQAIYCLIDNAYKYKSEGATIDVKIDKNDIVITNKTDAEKFTPGTGIAIAGRILEQHKLHLNTAVKAGIFEAKITKKPVKK
ncbi:MAG: HAMP domain-containing histidine kinase [Clostridiales bacterium]|nr:HAMP domain-containing histidine kinase [Clostridiales bacterium]